MARIRILGPLVAIAAALCVAEPDDAEAASPLAEVIRASGQSARLDVGIIAALYAAGPPFAVGLRLSV